jgi:hypothetical protein
VAGEAQDRAETQHRKAVRCSLSVGPAPRAAVSARAVLAEVEAVGEAVSPAGVWPGLTAAGTAAGEGEPAVPG